MPTEQLFFNGINGATGEYLLPPMAAEAMIVPGLFDPERVTLIRSLVPVAAANPTALDTVLARLLLEERPVDPKVLNRLAELAPVPKEGMQGGLRGALTVVPP